jgi:antitoxin MazE
MKSKIVTIGNSQGIRIPKVLLAQANLSGEVELSVCEQGLLISKSKQVRENWDSIFKNLGESDDGELILPNSSGKRGDWKW